MSGGAHRAAAPAEPAVQEEPATGSRWVVLLLLAGTLLLIAVDTTILNVALPTLVSTLHADSVQQLWIVDGYALAMAALLLTTGALGARVGRRLVLLFGLAIFALASLGAVVAETPGQLIAARVGLGIGAAAILPATLSMLRQVFTDPGERAFAFGGWSVVFAVGLAIGPQLGAWLIRVYGWHSVFVVNVPLALAAMLLGRWLLPDARRLARPRWDWWGMVLSIVAVAGLAHAVDLAGTDGFTDPWAIAALVVGGLALFCFVRRSLRVRTPLLDLSLFAERTFSAAALAVLLPMFALVGLLFLTSQWLLYTIGLTTSGTAVHLLPLPVALIVGTLCAPVLLARLPTRYVLSGALLLVGVGLLLPGFAAAIGALPYGVVGWCLALVGLGCGVSATTASVVLLTGVGPREAGVAAMVDQLAYTVGGAVGVAALGGVALGVYRVALPALHAPAAQVAAARDSVGRAAAASADRSGPLSAAFSAYNTSFAVVTMIAAAIVLLTAVLVYHLVPTDFRPRAGRR